MGGSPEAQIFKLLKSKGPMSADTISKELGDADVAKAGTSSAMKNKWISVAAGSENDEKDAKGKPIKKMQAASDSVDDTVQAELLNFASLDEKKKGELKKRKLCVPTSATSFFVKKTENFTLEEVKKAAEVTADMIRDGSWATLDFKPFNFDNANGEPCMGGSLH